VITVGYAAEALGKASDRIEASPRLFRGCGGG